MNKYNFDKLANRKNTNSVKWDLAPDTLPLWVADMDFEAPDFIVDALQKRVDIKAYGYSLIPEEFYTSVISWWNKRHHVRFDRDWLVYTNGVVAAISSVVRRISKPNDNVVVMSPVYNIFYNSIVNNQRVILDCPLVYENGFYHIDFSDFIHEYYSFNIYVTYNDFIKQTENESLNIKSVSLVDGNGSLFYKKVITKELNFKLSFFAKYKEAAQNYREYMLLYGEGHSVTTFERKDALLQKINQITKDNIEIFIERPSKTIVLSDTRYVVIVSLTLAIYLSISIVVTKIIFFKKN